MKNMSTSMSTDVLVGFGANQGDPEAMYRRVQSALGTRWPLRASGLYRTRAVGFDSNAPDYCNGVFRLEVGPETEPEEFLNVLLNLELELGRTRDGVPWSSRVIDLDLLLYGNRIIDLPPTLILPHPMIPWREFVLRPARDVASDMVHPAVGLTLGELLFRLESTAPQPMTISDFTTLPPPYPPGTFLVYDALTPLPPALSARALLHRIPILARRSLKPGLDFEAVVSLINRGRDSFSEEF